MKWDEIVIDEAGVTIFGSPVGLAPTSGDFEAALLGRDVRTVESVDKPRALRICDEHGLMWLVDLTLDAVLWLDIALRRLSHRRMTDEDAKGVFTGRILIGRYTVHGPFSFQTGEIIRKVVIPGLSLGLAPDRKGLRAVSVAFTENERALDSGRDARAV
jgi:hypothetical protein